MFIVLYGPEGSGKSTQGKMLAKKLNLPFLNSGNLVRHYAQKDQGIMGDICREALKLGHYVADSEMFVLWKIRLKESDVQNGFVIDGFPRNHDQALFLDDKLDKYGQKLNFVFYLDVSEKESIKRLAKRKRLSPDGSLHDSPGKIRSRLRIYQNQEQDVLNYFKKQNLLKKINGQQSIEEIHSDILKVIKHEF